MLHSSLLFNISQTILLAVSYREVTVQLMGRPDSSVTTHDDIESWCFLTFLTCV